MMQRRSLSPYWINWTPERKRAVIPLANEIDHKIDYILKHLGADGYLEITKKNSFTTDEIYQYLKRCEAEHLDPETGRPLSEKVSENRDAVYMLLDKVEKKIDGVRQQVVCNTAQNFLTILRNDDRFQNVRYNTLRGLPEKIINGKAVQWTDADDAISRKVC